MTDQSPPEDLLPHPEFLTEFPYNVFLRRFAPGEIRATRRQLERFRAFAAVGDPLADAVVEKMDRRSFERALRDGIDSVPNAPEALRALFAQVDEVPFWLDAEQLELGARAIRRGGVWGLFALRGLALMGGYLASRPDKTLVATGNLEAAAPRRLVETASWWLDATEPGGLARDAAGFQNTVRVRVMHAQVRAAMRRRRDWDYQAWDHPVNQVQTVGTLVLFSLAFLVGTQALGMRYTADERAAVVHLWRYVGFLMGVDAELLPATEADTWRVFWLEAATEFVPDEDSYRLAQALVTTVGPGGDRAVDRLTRWAVGNFVSSYSRLVLGRRNADFLGLPDNKPFQAAVLGISAANLALELARSVVPGATRLSELVGASTRRRLVGQAVDAVHADLGYSDHRPARAPLEPTG
ncbi:oxygenase MpaB family protein [Pseudonocardia acaciae]|uniref:oxygenase MpaB family protein n=1 Tax=Pseudonocardia acaciae TaxID=551276 RepID=UPI0007E8DDAB|nr:oxygenase MpaB family protein [Pseudonocardia acaciae]